MAVKLPTQCIICGTRLTSANRASTVERAMGFDDMCVNDYIRSGLENEHQDGEHEDNVDNCPMCEDTDETPEMETEMIDTKITVANPTSRRYINHRDHNHPCTPKARAACRAGLSTPSAPVAVNASIGSGKAVHALVGTDAVRCGAKVVNVDAIHTTADAVTCRNCIKLAD